MKQVSRFRLVLVTAAVVLAVFVVGFSRSSKSVDQESGDRNLKKKDGTKAKLRLAKDSDNRVISAEIERADDVGAELAGLQSHKSIREIFLIHCRKIGPSDVAALGKFDDLITIEFINCRIDEDAARELSKNERIANLAFVATPVTATTLSCLKTCTNLRHLSLRVGGFADDALIGLRSLKQLHSLQIEQQDFDVSRLSVLEHLPQLRLLQLLDTQPSAKDLRSLPMLPDIREFKFIAHSVNDADLVYLKQLPKLEILDLSSSKVTSDGIRNLDFLKGLKTLRIEGCKQVTDEAVDHLLRCNSLQELSITDTRISTGGFLRLAQLKNLRKLTVHSGVANEKEVRAFNEALPDCEIIRIKPPPRIGG
jgi:hypothetical protein